LKTAYSSTPELNPFIFSQHFNANCSSPYAISIRWRKILPRSSRVQQRHRRQTIDNRSTDRRTCDNIRRTSPKKQCMGVAFRSKRPRSAGLRAGDGVLRESGSEPHDRHFLQLRSLRNAVSSCRAFLGRGIFLRTWSWPSAFWPC